MAAISAAARSCQPNESGPVGVPGPANATTTSARYAPQVRSSEWAKFAKRMMASERHADRTERDDGAGEDTVGERLDHRSRGATNGPPPRNAAATPGSSSKSRAVPAKRLRPSVKT